MVAKSNRKGGLNMGKKIIEMPGALGPYSPAVVADDYIYVSGQVGFKNPQDGSYINGIENQTRQCFKNMTKVLEAAGATLDDVVKVSESVIQEKTEFSTPDELMHKAVEEYIAAAFGDDE